MNYCNFNNILDLSGTLAIGVFVLCFMVSSNDLYFVGVCVSVIINFSSWVRYLSESSNYGETWWSLIFAFLHNSGALFICVYYYDKRSISLYVLWVCSAFSNFHQLFQVYQKQSLEEKEKLEKDQIALQVGNNMINLVNNPNQIASESERTAQMNCLLLTSIKTP